MYRGFDPLKRRRHSQTTRTCAKGDPDHPDIPSASPSEIKNKYHYPHLHPPPHTHTHSDNARHLPPTLFLSFLYSPAFRRLNSVLSCSSNNLARVVLFFIFLTFEDPLPPTRLSAQREVICFRDYCTCVGNLRDWLGWGGGSMLRNATVNSCVRSIKMYLMVQKLRHIANYEKKKW